MSKKVQDKNKDSILIRSNVDNHIALKAHNYSVSKHNRIYYKNIFIVI